MRAFALVALLLSAPALAQTGALYADSAAVRFARYDVAVDSAFARYERGDYAESADRYAAAFDNLLVPRSGDLYNAACSAALAGRVGQGYEFLHRALRAGWENTAHMDVDPDLAALRAYPDLWAEAHAAAARALAARYPDYDADLAARLADIYASDQGIRQEFGALQAEHGFPLPDSVSAPFMARWHAVDSLNLGRVEAIIGEHGWPGQSLVGKQGASAVFLVVQHAPLEVQERYLPLMEAAVAEGEAEPSALALLVDRVRVRNGEPQVYGSQVWMNPETGTPAFYPIEDSDRVDARRAEVGLEPLATYGAHFGLGWPSETGWPSGEGPAGQQAP